MKRPTDHIERVINDDGDDLARLDWSLGANYKITIINSLGMPT